MNVLTFHYRNHLSYSIRSAYYGLAWLRLIFLLQCYQFLVTEYNLCRVLIRELLAMGSTDVDLLCESFFLLDDHFIVLYHDDLQVIFRVLCGQDGIPCFDGDLIESFISRESGNFGFLLVLLSVLDDLCFLISCVVFGKTILKQ